MVKAITDLGGSQRSGRQSKEHTARVGRGRLHYYLAAAVAIGYVGGWTHVALLWFLPSFTILPVILRIRSIAEHFGVEADHDLNSSRNFAGPVWERLLLAPHSVGHHLDHHLFPSVPFYNLHRLNRVLMTDIRYAKEAHQNDRLISSAPSSVMWDVTERHSGANTL